MSAENSALDEFFKEHAGGISLTVALGTFLLYASGHLAQRFYLQVLGLDVETPIVNEGALYLGANFVFYLITSLPLWLVPLLPFYLLRHRLRALAAKASPKLLTMLALLWAVAAFQLVARHVFSIRKVLIGGDFESALLRSLLLEGVAARQLFFVALGLACLPTLAWVFRLVRAPALLPTLLGKVAKFVLILLATAQVLLLPIYFGTFTALGKFPRVQVERSVGTLPPGTGTLWKLHADEQYTHFLHESTGDPPSRRILAVKTETISTIEILDYDELVKRVCGVGTK